MCYIIEKNAQNHTHTHTHTQNPKTYKHIHKQYVGLWSASGVSILRSYCISMARFTPVVDDLEAGVTRSRCKGRSKPTSAAQVPTARLPKMFNVICKPIHTYAFKISRTVIANV